MCSQATLSTPRKIYYKWKNVAYCFLCGSTSNPDRFTNINSACGKRKALAEKIKNVLGIDIEETTSHLPICRVCERKVNNFTAFKTSAMSVIEGIREKTTSKRCLNFSPAKAGKRINVGESDDNVPASDSDDDIPIVLDSEEISLVSFRFHYHCKKSLSFFKN